MLNGSSHKSHTKYSFLNMLDDKNTYDLIYLPYIIRADIKMPQCVILHGTQLMHVYDSQNCM